MAEASEIRKRMNRLLCQELPALSDRIKIGTVNVADYIDGDIRVMVKLAQNSFWVRFSSHFDSKVFMPKTGDQVLELIESYSGDGLKKLRAIYDNEAKEITNRFIGNNLRKIDIIDVNQIFSHISLLEAYQISTDLGIGRLSSSGSVSGRLIVFLKPQQGPATTHGPRWSIITKYIRRDLGAYAGFAIHPPDFKEALKQELKK